MTYYCYNRQSGHTCPEATAADIANFQAGMTACFKKAVAIGLTTIAVAPHLDDGLGYGECLQRLKEDGECLPDHPSVVSMLGLHEQGTIEGCDG